MKYMGNPLQHMASDFATVVVTGGSSGIGNAFIRQLQSLNESLLFCNLSRSEPRFDISGLRLRHYPCDLAGPESRKGAFDALANDLPPGRILLVNNSGFGSYGVFPEPGLARQLEMIDVNVRAPVELTGRLLPLLRERGGAVVNVASTAAFQPTPFMATYGAGKAFLLHWSLALDRDLAPAGIPVLAVCPGPTATEFFRSAGFEERVVSPAFSQTPEAVVSASLKALARRRKLCVTGWKNRIAAALAARLPKTWAAAISGAVVRRLRVDSLGNGGDDS